MLNGQLMVQICQMVDEIYSTFQASKIPSTYLKDWTTRLNSPKIPDSKYSRFKCFVKLIQIICTTNIFSKIKDLEKQKEIRTNNIAKS